MKLSMIPAPEAIYYLEGFTKKTAKVIKRIDSSLGREEFRIRIENVISITAADEAGLFYAENALEQIKFQCGMNLPNVYIQDAPRYAYRAFMIDCCRHYFGVEELKTMITRCAKMRFNVFHWHLTDDQGWRPEIKAYPELVETGSVRHGSNFAEEQNNDDYSGHFTREQMEEVIEFAHRHHMKVVPEIDMPGHASALLASLPHLVCGNKSVNIKTSPGIFNDIICAGSEKTYETLFTILDEICDIFPDEYIHLGGDEAPKGQWKSCPCCQKRIKDENLEGEEALQGYFINRITEHLESKGRKVITWNESLKSGNLKDSVIVERWMDPKKLAVNSPNKIIVSDFYHMYADYPYAMTPVSKVYNYNTKLNGNVIGTDIPIWTEYVRNMEYMEYMCFPRFIATAQDAWSRKKPSYSQFRTELEELLPWFETGNHAKSSEWDPPSHSRLAGTLRHFMGINPVEQLKNLVKGKKEQES